MPIADQSVFGSLFNTSNTVIKMCFVYVINGIVVVVFFKPLYALTTSPVRISYSQQQQQQQQQLTWLTSEILCFVVSLFVFFFVLLQFSMFRFDFELDKNALKMYIYMLSWLCSSNNTNLQPYERRFWLIDVY